MIDCILLKCTNSSLVIHFQNFVQLFYLQVLLINILHVFFVIFFHLQFLMITLAIILFAFVFQIKNANLSRKFLVSCYNVTSLFTNISLQKTIDIAINFIFNHNCKPWFLLQLLSLLISSWVFPNLNGYINITLTNQNFI